jgi:hypothetical protein
MLNQWYLGKPFSDNGQGEEEISPYESSNLPEYDDEEIDALYLGLPLELVKAK